MSNTPTISLSTFLQNYLAEGEIDIPKYFPRYAISAKWAWKELFQKTLYVVQSHWFPVLFDGEYYYIDLPKCVSRIISVGVEDKYGKIQPLYNNAQWNVVAKPTKQCNCGCSCDGLCNDGSTTTVTTKEVFRINNVPYYERTWLKICKNGDVVEYREVPTKKYNDYTGTPGDFNGDFNDDFSKPSAFENFTVQTEVFQKILCKLDVAPCGCPTSTDENLDKLHTHCGWDCRGGWRKRPRQTFENVNNNYYGEVKLSPCGTKVYYRLAKHGKIPDYLLLSWQGTGEEVGLEVQVPEYAYEALSAMLFWRTIRRNPRYSQSDKVEAERIKNMEINNLILYLNPLSWNFLANVSDTEIRW